MQKNRYQGKVFGGTNFIVVLWMLISFFRFGLLFGDDSLNAVMYTNLAPYIIPLIFLLVLNLMMTVGLFFPNAKDRVWVLSIIVATTTLIMLNTFQMRFEDIRMAHAREVNEIKF